MKQRGWKDHFMVHYEEKDASNDSEADDGGALGLSSGTEDGSPPTTTETGS
jgi:hypothetical protein